MPAATHSIQRTVSASMTLDVGERADLVLAIAVAEPHSPTRETIDVALDGVQVRPSPVTSEHGTRLHQLRGVEPGRLVVEYEAVIEGRAEPPVVADDDWFRYIRPSRYCESDRLGPLARDQFAGLEGADLIDGVASWVGTHIAYVSGSSRPTDGAVATLLARSGVCRDFAHLTVAMLRANGVPARVVAVYAPGLDPMDFHAVVEACVDGAWYVVDPTALAPRSSMVRVATGADAADTAFLTTVAGAVELVDLEVRAIVEPELPDDDVGRLVQLR